MIVRGIITLGTMTLMIMRDRVASLRSEHGITAAVLALCYPLYPSTSGTLASLHFFFLFFLDEDDQRTKSPFFRRSYLWLNSCDL